MPVSVETRVRVDRFWKIIPTLMFSRGRYVCRDHAVKASAGTQGRGRTVFISRDLFVFHFLLDVRRDVEQMVHVFLKNECSTYVGVRRRLVASSEGCLGQILEALKVRGGNCGL